MAFDILGFNCTRGTAPGSATSNNSTLHFYKSTVDTVATITGGGYFIANFGLYADNILDNDVIRITGTDSTSDWLVTNSAASTLAPFSSSYPLITTSTQTISLSGIWAAPHNVDFKFVRADYGSGFVITQLTCETGALFPATTASVITFGSLLTYLPVGGGESVVLSAQDNADLFPCRFVFNNSFAQVSLFSPAVTFSGLSTFGDSGFEAFSISYQST